MDFNLDTIAKISGLTVSSCVTLMFPQNQWCI